MQQLPLVQHGLVRIELNLRRAQWRFFGVFLLVLGIPAALGAAVFLFVAIVDRNAGALVGVVFGAMLGGVAVPAGFAAWRIARSHPVIVVADDNLTIEHSGFFANPVHLGRSAVHSVYMRDFQAVERPPQFEGRAWQRLRQWSRWIDRRGVSAGPLPISSWHCPDLSLLNTVDDRNLLILMANSMPMRGVSRRGLGALTLAIARGMTFTGPTKATVARGFFAAALDADQARQALASWATGDSPDPELWDWLYAGTNRGFGWLGWRSRHRARQPS